jgi:predicted choloylglycine hydrolase
MAKKRTLFSLKQNENQINMDVDESLYNHFQTLTPLQQKAVKDSMTLKYLQNTCK